MRSIDVASPKPPSDLMRYALAVVGISFLIMGCVALLTLAFVGIANAQVVAAGAPATVDLGPPLSWLVQIVAPTALTVLTGLATWAFKLFRQKTGWQIDASVGAIVDVGLQKAVNYAAAQLQDRAAGGIPIAVKSQAVAVAARYAEDKLPDALAHFGITGPKLSEMIESRLTDWLIDPASERANAPAAA